MALLETILEQEAIEEICIFLSQCGYSIEENQGADEPLLYFIAKEEKQKILNITHQGVFPKKLLHTLIRRIVGNFFYLKLRSGQLKLGENLDLSGAVSEIKEGDTSVSFREGASDLERLDALINYLQNYGEKEIRCFRRIKWQ